jgi:Rod binding domain-containing protein
MSYSMNAMDATLQRATTSRGVPQINKNVDDKALREQTDAFEAVFIKMLMDTAAKDEKNLFSDQKDPGDKIYKSMYRDELSKVSAGGFGFSQMLYDYLSR